MILNDLISNLLHSPYYTAILIIILITIVKYYASKQKTFWSDRNLVAGQSSSMIMNIFRKRPLEEIQLEATRKYGKLFGAYHFGKPTIFCSEPELLSLILSKEFASFPNRRSFKLGNDPLIENMLSLLTDDKWKRIRSIVSPTFTTGKLRKMRPLIDDCLKTLINNFNNLIKESEEVDMKRIFGAFTMEVVIQVAFGTKVDALIDDKNPIIMNAKKILAQDMSLVAILKIATAVMCPKVASFLKFRFIPKEVTDFFEQFVLKIIEERKKNKSTVKRYDFLQLLLDAMDNENVSEEIESKVEKSSEHEKIFEEQKFVTHNKSMSDTELISQCILFFFAGYETTATTLSFAAHYIACNPEVQQKLYEESKAIFESKIELDYDSVQRLEYLDAVISETLRMSPPATALERIASEDITLGNEQIKVKKGDVIRVPIYSLHKNPDNFSEPEAFKPKRFLPENRSHHPYSYLPFGAGPRNCVARRLALMEAKLALLYSVYNFKFSTTDKTDVPPKCYFNNGLLIPKQVLLKVEKR